jgi:hypothetical protein
LSTPQTNLRVRISGDLADIKAGLLELRGGLQATKRAAGSSMDGLDGAGAKVRSFVSVARAGFATLAGVVAGAAAAVKGAIDSADELGKTAQKVGIGTQALSELAYAAKLADVGLDALRTGLGQFNKQLVGNEALIRELGIATRGAGGDFRATEAILADLSDVFQELPDGPQKSALAIKLFGRAGADLIPLLNSGSSALAEMAQEARDLGVSISDDAAKQAELFNDNLTRLQSAVSGFANAVAAKVLPALSALAQTQAENARASGAASEGATVLANALKVVAGAALVAKNVFEGVLNVVFFLATATGAVAKAINQDLGASFQILANAWEKLKDGKPIEALRGYVAEAAVLRDNELSDITRLPGEISAAWDSMRRGLSESGSDIGIGLEKIFSELDQGTAGAKADIAAIGTESAAAEARAKQLQQTLDRLLGGQGEGKNSNRDEEAKIKRELERAAKEVQRLKDEEARLIKERGTRIAAGLAEVENELLRSTGKGAEAAFRELEARYAQLLADLRSAGDSEGEAALERLLGIKKVQIKLEELRGQVQSVLGGLSSNESSISDQASAGFIGAIEAEQSIASLRDAAFEKLVALRAELQAYYEETKDPSVLAFLQELDGNLGRVAASQQVLRQQTEDLAVSSLSSFFSDLATAAKSAKDAFRDLVVGFVQGLARMASELLAKRVIFSLFGMFGGGDGAGSFLKGAGGALKAIGVKHSGGAPEQGTKRLIPRGLFDAHWSEARRYHEGVNLAANEIPAILQTGERVLSREQNRELSNQAGGQKVLQPIVVLGEAALANALAGAAGREIVLTHVRDNLGSLGLDPR